MTYNVNDIKHETKDYFVLKINKPSVSIKGGVYTYHEVYKNSITHATRVAQCAGSTDCGLQRAIETCNNLQTRLT